MFFTAAINPAERLAESIVVQEVCIGRFDSESENTTGNP
jgi:hypothetical protein